MTRVTDKKQQQKNAYLRNDSVEIMGAYGLALTYE